MSEKNKEIIFSNERAILMITMTQNFRRKLMIVRAKPIETAKWNIHRQVNLSQQTCNLKEKTKKSCSLYSLCFSYVVKDDGDKMIDMPIRGNPRLDQC